MTDPVLTYRASEPVASHLLEQLDRAGNVYKKFRETLGPEHPHTSEARRAFISAYNEAHGKPPQVEESTLQKMERRTHP